MTDKEALKLALEALEADYLAMVADGNGHMVYLEDQAITAIKEALAQPEPMAVYGYCPQCGAKGAMRERRPNGNDKCANGHTYPSSTSTPPQRKPLTDEEIDELSRSMVKGDKSVNWLCRAIEAAHGIQEDK